MTREDTKRVPPQRPPPGCPACALLTCELATGPLLLALELPAAPALLMLARAWRAFSHSGFSCMGVSMPFSLPAPATMLYWEDLRRAQSRLLSRLRVGEAGKATTLWDHRSPLCLLQPSFSNLGRADTRCVWFSVRKQ